MDTAGETLGATPEVLRHPVRRHSVVRKERRNGSIYSNCTTIECKLCLCSIGLGETDGKGALQHKEPKVHNAELTEVCRYTILACCQKPSPLVWANK
jgi:hypothetical protein